MAYTQIARQVWLQPLGMGALTVLHAAPASPPEQSKEPCPEAGDTHDGGGGGGRHTPEASQYAHPSGQMPASGRNPMHPYAGVRQSSDGEQSASPHANVPASIEAASPSAAWSLAASVPPSPAGEAVPVAPPQATVQEKSTTTRPRVIAGKSATGVRQGPGEPLTRLDEELRPSSRDPTLRSPLPRNESPVVPDGDDPRGRGRRSRADSYRVRSAAGGVVRPASPGAAASGRGVGL